MTRLSSYFPLIIAAILAATTFWLEQVVRNEFRSNDGKTRHDPDFMVENLAVDRFDATGQRVSRLTAKHLQHYPDDDTADIIEPVLTITRDARPIIFTSKTAHASNNTKIIVMREKVRGERGATADSPAQTLITEELTLLSNDEIARTPKPVFFTQGAARLSGIGAEWNNLTGQFTIRSHLRAEFPPATPSSQP